jgi:hypothetical protein
MNDKEKDGGISEILRQEPPVRVHKAFREEAMKKLIAVEETTVLGYHYTDDSSQISVSLRHCLPTT